MGCLPFSEALYGDLQQQGLDAGDLWSEPNRYGRRTRWFRNSEALEDDLRWLISVGVLRREVDGQGLTSAELTWVVNSSTMTSAAAAFDPAAGSAASQPASALAVVTHTTPRPLMVLGTSSGAGKSLMTAALCRVLQRRGEQALPFKART